MFLSFPFRKEWSYWAVQLDNMQRKDTPANTELEFEGRFFHHSSDKGIQRESYSFSLTSPKSKSCYNLETEKSWLRDLIKRWTRVNSILWGWVKKAVEIGRLMMSFFSTEPRLTMLGMDSTVLLDAVPDTWTRHIAKNLFCTGESCPGETALLMEVFIALLYLLFLQMTVYTSWHWIKLWRSVMCCISAGKC